VNSLASGSVGNCTSNTDYACLCESTVYSNSVGVSPLTTVDVSSVRPVLMGLGVLGGEL